MLLVLVHRGNDRMMMRHTYIRVRAGLKPVCLGGSRNRFIQAVRPRPMIYLCLFFVPCCDCTYLCRSIIRVHNSYQVRRKEGHRNDPRQMYLAYGNWYTALLSASAKPHRLRTTMKLLDTLKVKRFRYVHNPHVFRIYLAAVLYVSANSHQGGNPALAERFCEQICRGKMSV